MRVYRLQTDAGERGSAGYAGGWRRPSADGVSIARPAWTAVLDGRTIPELQDG
jgi:hypothetical protein